MTEPLDIMLIKNAITSANLSKISEIKIFRKIDSTNSFLLKMAKLEIPTGTVYFAEEQTSGRGRQGKTWFSPAYHNVYGSLLWKFNETTKVNGLSLCVGIILAKLLEAMGIDVQLKWPNDIYVNGKKLAGILIENIVVNNNRAVIIGFGINIDLHENKNPEWIDIKTILKKDFSRNKIAGLILNSLCENLIIFEKECLEFFLKDWQKYDFLFNKKICVLTPFKKNFGICKGVSHDGLLILEDANKVFQYFHEGETSVRADS